MYALWSRGPKGPKGPKGKEETGTRGRVHEHIFGLFYVKSLKNDVEAEMKMAKDTIKKRIIVRVVFYMLIICFVLTFWGKFSYINLSSEEAVYRNMDAEEFIKYFEKVAFAEDENGDTYLSRWEEKTIPIALYFEKGDINVINNIINYAGKYTTIAKKNIKLKVIKSDHKRNEKVIIYFSKRKEDAFKDIYNIYKNMGFKKPNITGNCFKGVLSVGGKIKRVSAFVSTEESEASRICLQTTLAYIFGMNDFSDFTYSSMLNYNYYKKIFGYRFSFFDLDAFDFVKSSYNEAIYDEFTLPPLDRLGLKLLYSDIVVPGMTLSEFRNRDVQLKVKNFYLREARYEFDE